MRKRKQQDNFQIQADSDKEVMDSFDSLTNDGASFTGEVSEHGYPYFEDEGGKS